MRPRDGMELDLGPMDPRHRPLRELSQDFDISGSSINSAMFSLDGQFNDTAYQLFLLWKGVWSSLVEQKQRLEGTLEVWRNFEIKKEEFCDFLSNSEERVNLFFKNLSECKDLTVVQTEISTQQVFDHFICAVFPLHTKEQGTYSTLLVD